MGNFFKSFGKGILYVLVLPVLIIILAVYAVAALIGFIYLTIKGIILFFTGRSLFDDLPEDKKAKAIIKANTINPDNYIPEADMPADNDTNKVSINHSMYQKEEDRNIESAPFYVPEYLKPQSEENKEEKQEEKEEEDLIDVNDFAYIHEKQETNIEKDDPMIEPVFREDTHVEEEEKENKPWNGDTNDLRL